MTTASAAVWCRALVAGAIVLSLSNALIAAPAPVLPLDEDILVGDLAKCLSSDGHEVVFFPDQKFECVKFRSGGQRLAHITPPQRDPAIICRPEHQTDQRRLRLSTIKKIAKHGEKIGINGIRLIGAVFCRDEVNLNELDLPYSLVLDHGVFRYGIRADGFSTRGNFSVEDSFVFDNLFLRKAKIEGSLFLRRSFILNAAFIDTEVGSRTYLEDSLLQGTVYLERFIGKGDVRFKNAAFPNLIIQQSTIRGRLDLEKTEARCAYVIRGGQIDDIHALDLGFGVMSVEQPAAGPGAALPKKRYEWNRTTTKPYYARFIQNESAKQLIAEHNCIDSPGFLPRFQVTMVEARSFCLQDFHWQTSQSNPAEVKSEVNLSELTISGNAIVNLWPQQADDAGINQASRILKMHGVSVRELYFDFSDRDRPHIRSIDRLQMDRVHAADIGCESTAREDQSRLPDPNDVKMWLRNNTSSSLQPFVAFIKAYENSGASSTALKVAKADIEFERTHAAWKNQAMAAWDRGTLLGDSLHLAVDYLQNCVTWLTGWIAGYGFRPGQVIWYAVAIVVVFWLLFWLALGVVAFVPDKKTTLRVVGFLFVFDRLFPVYKFRDDNYNIAQYLKRGTGPDQQTFKYFGRSVDCIPATERQVRWAGIYLDMLRAIGIVLAIFLVAAINALVVK